MTMPSSPQSSYGASVDLSSEALHPQSYTHHVADRDMPVTSYARSGAASVARTMPNPLWRESLNLMKQHVPFGQIRVKDHDEVYFSGKPFEVLYLISSGLFKIVNLAPDGREQPAGLFFKGDWLGFDGIPTGNHSCSAVAVDGGELWTVRYETLLRASVKEPQLMRMVLAAVSAQLARNRDAVLSMGTLGADARVADFLLQWALALQERGMRTDEIDIHMSRADIGSHLGLRLESVSRALSRLSHGGVILFKEKGRRVINIPNLDALRDFINHSTDAAAELH